MARSIITRCMGPSRAPRQQVDGNAKHCQIVLECNDGSQEILFVGSDYDQEEWEKQMKAAKRTIWEAFGSSAAPHKHNPVESERETS